VDTTFTLKQNIPFTIKAVLKNPSCAKADGSIEITPSPVDNYTFTKDLVRALSNSLAAKTYNVRIANQSGCSIDTSFTLKGSPDFSLKANIQRSLCGKSDGALNLVMTPSTSSDVYIVSGDLTSISNSGLQAKTYKINVARQGTSCTLDTSLVVGNLADFGIFATLSKPTCGSSDGRITFVMTPSTLTYSVAGDLTALANSNLAAKVYKVTITSSNGCAKDTSFELLGQPNFTINPKVTGPGCNKTDGRIDLNISPAGASYEFLGDLKSAITNNLAAGTYNVRIVSGGTNACAKDTSFTFRSVKPIISLGAKDTIAICDNKPRLLKVKLTDSLNIAYNYTWYAGKDTLKLQLKDTITVNPDSTTRYIVDVKVDNGCASFDTVVVAKPSTIMLHNTTHDFVNDKFVKLTFSFKNRADYPSDSVYIYRKASAAADWKMIDSIPKNRNEYFNTLGNPSGGSYYYKIGLANQLNVCGEKLESKTQRTVKLSARGDEELETSYLNWNSFINWDSAVVEYQVWRGVEGGEIQYYFTANLDSIVEYINATDARKHCYRIRAIEKGGLRESWSNIACIDFLNLIKHYNIFTPNGDGHNDFLMFKNIKFYPGNELHVFNRWGNKVFSQSNYANNWDGDGLPAGTYYYILDLKDGSKPIQSDVLLHR
jgi:gliding motility-associated-like protein